MLISTYSPTDTQAALTSHDVSILIPSFSPIVPREHIGHALTADNIGHGRDEAEKSLRKVWLQVRLGTAGLGAFCLDSPRHNFLTVGGPPPK